MNKDNPSITDGGEPQDLGTPSPSGGPGPSAPEPSAGQGTISKETPPAQDWEARHKEATDHIRRLNEENKKYRDELDRRHQQERPKGPDFEKMTEEEYFQYFSKNPLKAQRELIQHMTASLESQSRHSSMQSVISSFERDTKNYPGFEELKPQIEEYLRANPDLDNPEETDPYRALQIAYHAVSYDWRMGQERKKWQEEQDRKAGIFSEGSTGTGAGTGGKKNLDDAIRDSIMNAGKKEKPSVFE